jgi:LysR family glycine cleavage system transcriptional activator
MAARLPPLNACRAFEAATRLGSFSRAAAELNVTPTAVSHHVKMLEAWTGRRLFTRQNNAIVPTDAARLLAPTIGEALERIAEGVQSLTAAAGPDLVSISVQPDFALKWLIPRLPRFSALYPRAELRLVTAYRSLDFLSEDIDLAVRYLEPSALAETGAELRAEMLLRADLVPILRPALFPPERAADPAVLRSCTLLHVLSAPEDWRRWLALAGVSGIDATRGPKFDSYALTGEAAAQGWGVALGRVGVIEADIAAGRLVAPFSPRLVGRRAWVLLTMRRSRKPLVVALRAFLLREAEAATAPAAPGAGTPDDAAPGYNTKL